MIQFDKPINLNGDELTAELANAGVELKKNPFVDAENKLWLNIKATDKTKAATVVAAHNGTIVAPEPTIEQKLASVGLNLNDLKSALGL